MCLKNNVDCRSSWQKPQVKKQTPLNKKPTDKIPVTQIQTKTQHSTFLAQGRGYFTITNEHLLEFFLGNCVGGAWISFSASSIEKYHNIYRNNVIPFFHTLNSVTTFQWWKSFEQQSWWKTVLWRSYVYEDDKQHQN